MAVAASHEWKILPWLEIGCSACLLGSWLAEVPTIKYEKVLGDDIMGKDPENSISEEGDCTVARQQADHQFPRITDSIVCMYILCTE